MAQLLKDLLTPELINVITKDIKTVAPSFRDDQFKEIIFGREWERLELKDRLRLMATALAESLPGTYPKQANTIIRLKQHLKKRDLREVGLGFFFLPEFIGMNGIDFPEVSYQVMEQLTQLITCEFAIRPFFLAFPQKTLAQMKQWSHHPHDRVRRLASEGCRPRLPWGMALPAFISDPRPLIPILDSLKDDASEDVRRSVANNLNDISKDHPQIVLDLAKEWIGYSTTRDRLIKHACRTLLKAGNQEAMELFGFKSPEKVDISELIILTPSILVGDELIFTFQITNQAVQATDLRLEYVINYQKAQSKLAKKVYQIGQITMAPREVRSFRRKRSFKPITTRRFYPGRHELAIIVNGREVGRSSFVLSVDDP